MTIHVDELLKIIATLCDERNLKVTVSQSFKGGLITAVSTIAGGLLLGRAGLALGGILGGVAAGLASNEFQPLSTVIRKLPQKKKEELYSRLKNAFKDFGLDDITLIGTLLLSQASVQEIAIREVTNYFQNNMSMQVKRV